MRRRRGQSILRFCKRRFVKRAQASRFLWQFKWQLAPTFLLTEARSWANVTSRRGHQYRNGHQANTSCCLLHCLSSSAGAQTLDYASQSIEGKTSAPSKSLSQNDCSTSAAKRKLLKGHHALTVNHKLQRITAQALTCSGRDSTSWQQFVLQA